MAPQRLSLDNAQRRLRQALEKRARLLNDTRVENLRLVHAEADGMPGLVIERFGKVLIVQILEGHLTMTEDTLAELVAGLGKQLSSQAIYRKLFVRDRAHAGQDVDLAHRQPAPWFGTAADEEFATQEFGSCYLIRPFDGFSVGLFLEHRENRQRIIQAASGKRVLNLFAYTCGFSVAAAKGGAIETVSVDLASRYLEWGKRNFSANDLSHKGHWFMKSDVFDYIKRAKRQSRSFDLAIIDPPSFSRARRGKATFALNKDLKRLVRETFALLEPGAEVLLATNHRQIGWSRLREAVEEAAKQRPFILNELALPVDFEGDENYARSLWIKLDRE